MKARPRKCSTRVLGLASAVGLTMTLALTAITPAMAETANKPAEQSCSLVNEKLTVTSSPNTALNQKFTTYGNTSGEWVGADTTNSVPLKDGSTAWLFSDTLYGNVVNGTLAPTDSFFLNNSVIVEKGGKLVDTKTGGTPTTPDGLVPPASNGDWHWFGDGELRPNGDLQVGVLKFGRFGDGYWDWGWKSNQVATIDTKTWKLKSLDPLPSSANIQWASYYTRVGGHTLIYGVEDLGASKHLHIAKVLGGDLTKLQNWRYWTGATWSKTETDSVRVLTGVANEISVNPYKDGYILITQDTTVPFSNEVVAYTSCSPTGPFTNKTKLFNMPEVGLWGSYGDPNVFAYNAHEHVQLREGNTLVVSYNVNTFDSNQIYKDVTIYRPRFVNVTLS